MATLHRDRCERCFFGHNIRALQLDFSFDSISHVIHLPTLVSPAVSQIFLVLLENGCCRGIFYGICDRRCVQSYKDGLLGSVIDLFW
jgi:hypothetical protein